MVSLLVITDGSRRGIFIQGLTSIVSGIVILVFTGSISQHFTHVLAGITVAELCERTRRLETEAGGALDYVI